MCEMEHMIDIELIEEDEHKEHHRLREIFAENGNDDVAVGLRHQFLATLHLQFHAQRIGGDEEHEQHHHTWHEHGG